MTCPHCGGPVEQGHAHLCLADPLPRRQVKLMLCPACAGKLRSLRDAHGVEAMAKAIGRVLCTSCRRQIPGYETGPLETVLKMRS
jgi:hypothetical protein